MLFNFFFSPCATSIRCCCFHCSVRRLQHEIVDIFALILPHLKSKPMSILKYIYQLIDYISHSRYRYVQVIFEFDLFIVVCLAQIFDNSNKHLISDMNLTLFPN